MITRNIIFVLFIALTGQSTTGSLKAVLDSLVDAERSFARLSATKGTRDAFLANLNDDSILFRPDAVPGKSWTEKSPPSASQLSWEPAFADIAASGDLGYTTGPWEMRRTPQDAPGAFGHYVTVWKRQPDGSWKIAIDFGNSHDAAPKPARVESPKIGAVVQKRVPEPEIATARTKLLDAERTFPANTAAYRSQFAADARLYRNESFPFVGEAAIRKTLDGMKGTFTWKVIKADVSGAADLGYAYGSVEFKPADSNKTAERSNYLRIWRRQDNGQWKVVLDLVA